MSASRSAFDGLTARQAQVLDALTEVGCNKAAARRLCISHKTVNEHMNMIFLRTGFHNRVLCLLAWDRLRRQPEGART